MSNIPDWTTELGANGTVLPPASMPMTSLQASNQIGTDALEGNMLNGITGLSSVNTSLSTVQGVGIFIDQANNVINIYQGSTLQVAIGNLGNGQYGISVVNGTITGATIVGGTIETSLSGQRVVIDGASNSLEFYDSSGNLTGTISGNLVSGNDILSLTTGNTTTTAIQLEAPTASGLSRIIVSNYGGSANVTINAEDLSGDSSAISVNPTNITVDSTGTVTVGVTPGVTVGFFGSPGNTQQIGGPSTASSTYGVIEQDMLQTVYDAMRAYGLLT